MAVDFTENFFDEVMGTAGTTPTRAPAAPGEIPSRAARGSRRAPRCPRPKGASARSRALGWTASWSGIEAR